MFLRLTLKDDDRSTYVNMDRVEGFSVYKGSTVLDFGGETSMKVKETPEEIFGKMNGPRFSTGL